MPAKSVGISPLTWLIHADFSTVGNTTFWAKSFVPVIEEDGTDGLYTVKTHDRFDNLAQKFYSDPRRWWVIARANNMFLAPLELLPTREIRIPLLLRVREEGVT